MEANAVLDMYADINTALDCLEEIRLETLEG
jgi:hypothetical protein